MEKKQGKPKIVYFCYDMASADYYEPVKKAIQDIGGYYLEFGKKRDTDVQRMITRDRRLKKVFKRPFMTRGKEVIFRRYFERIPADHDLILVFTMAWSAFILGGFVPFVKKQCEKRNQKVKTVLYLQDILSSYKIPSQISYIKEIFDEIITFDPQDAEEYGIRLFQGSPYSDLNIPKQSEIQTSDVFFCGYAKNRLPEILAMYEWLVKEGLQCDFYISGVEKDKQKYADKIHYNQYLPYRECLAHIMQSRCIMEIMQKSGAGYTFRTLEAVIYKKKLITNNQCLLDAPFYHKNNILVAGQSANSNITDFLALEYVESVEICDFRTQISGEAFERYLYSLI